MLMQPDYPTNWLVLLQRYCLVLMLPGTYGFLRGATPPAAPAMACPTINTGLTVLGSTYCNAVTGTILPTAKITIKNAWALSATASPRATAPST